MTTTFGQKYPILCDLDGTIQEKTLFGPNSKSKHAMKKIKHIPVDYLKWVYDNGFEKNMIKYPEDRIYIENKLLFGTSTNLLMNHPRCKCHRSCNLGYSKDNKRSFFNCINRKYNKFTKTYEGGCDFFAWGFPHRLLKQDQYSYNFTTKEQLEEEFIQKLIDGKNPLDDDDNEF